MIDKGRTYTGAGGILEYLKDRHPVIKYLKAFETPRGKRDGEHLHADLYQLILYTRGEGAVNILHEHWPIVPQAVYAVHPGELHDASSEGAVPLTGIICRFKLPGFSGRLLPTVVKPAELKAPEVEMLLKKALAEATIGEPANLIKAAFLLSELLILLSAEAELSTCGEFGQPLSELIAVGLAFMKTSFRDEIGVEDVAGHCGVTASHFSRAFKKEMGGVSPLAYLRKLRLGYALERLFSSRDKIARIAANSGFKTTKNLSLAFQQVHKMSPQEFRRRAYEGTGCGT